MYAGPREEFGVQFRLKSLALNMDIMTLAQNIYGDLVPPVSYHGQIGEDGTEKDPLSIYNMDRVQGISHLDFILAQTASNDSSDYCVWRENLISDIAKYIPSLGL